MRGIIASSLRFRALVIAVAAVLSAYGVWQLRTAPLDVVPEFAPLVLTVKTEPLGLSSAEVEALVTVPIEADLLNGVPWLRSIDSESMAGLSTIMMQFAPGTSLMHARQMVQERLTQAHALPNVAAPPVLLQPVSSTSRIMNIGLSSDTVSLIDMTVLAHWNVVPRLVGVPGVANVSIWGRRMRQLQVQVTPDRLYERGVTLEQIVKTAGEAVFASPLTFLNSSTPGSGGFIDTPNQRLIIRHVSPLRTPEHLARLPVAESQMLLGQVAELVEGHQPLIGDAIVRGGPALILAVEKFPGYSTEEVTRGVEAALAELRPGLRGIEVDSTIYRPAGFLERAADNLAAALLTACVLLALSLLAMLRSWRAALVGLASVVVSLLAAAVVLQLRGVDLNMMVLAGLMMALGVVVHDAILDVDDIGRRLRLAGAERSPGRSILAAALQARRPMLFATLILLVAVTPVLFAEGRFAALLQPVAWSYIAAVLASMVAALTVTPALSALLLSSPSAAESRPVNLLGGLHARFERMAGPSRLPPTAAFGLAAAAAVICIGAWAGLERAPLPDFKENEILVEWQGPPGTSLPAMTRVTNSLIKDLREIPGVRNAAAHIGRAVLCNCDQTEDVNAGAIWVSLDPRADRDATIAAIRAAVAEYPGMTSQVGTYLSKKLREAVAGDPERLTMRVYGHDPAVLRRLAEQVRGMLATVPGVVNPRVETETEELAIEIEVDLERASARGFKPGDIRRAASTLVGGLTVGALFEEQKVFEVVVWGAPEVRHSVADIENLLLEAEDARPVRLGEVAKVRLAPTTSVIRRHSSSRRLDVHFDVRGRSPSVVAQDVTARLVGLSFPFEYHARVLGEHLEARSALRSIESYVAAAAILAFLLLQSVLGSWRLAALSLVGVPVVLLGSLLGVVLDGRVISLGALLGAAAALSLAIRTGIMMVRRFQELEQEGMPFGAELVQRGLRERFPSTVIALAVTGAAVLPFVALGDVAGLEIAHPMAVAMLGGLVGAAVATLALTPALYLRFGAGTAADPIDLEPAVPADAARAHG